MTDVMVSVTEFKAKCLSLFSEVEAGEKRITVTRRGEPVAVITPPKARKKKLKSPAGSWSGNVEIVGDIMNMDFLEWTVLTDPDYVLNPDSKPSRSKRR